MIRKFAWCTMLLLAMFVALYSGALIVAPATRPGFVQNLFATVPILVVIHLAGGLIAILSGAFQVNSRLRARYLPLHRSLGWTYIAAVAAGGVAGLMMALSSDGGLVGHFGFGMLAVCWLFSTATALRHVLGGDVAAHRAWMLRSYALTLAAVTLRIYMPVFMMNGYEFSSVYPLVSWLCWVPNLLLVEWFILARKSAAPVANAG